LRQKVLFILLLAAYMAVMGPFVSHLKNRPLAVKLGYLPEAEALKMAVGDQRYLVAEIAVVKVLFYYGTLMEKLQHRIHLPPEYGNMFKTLQTAVKLDPYNMDAYYFAEAAFTWEVKRYREVNDLLLYGMKYRTWDYSLPFFTAFNAAYFMKDYRTAALYMKKAAELSREPLFVNLSARYLYEAGQNDLGIRFLEVMEQESRDKKIRKVYEIRKQALLAVKEISDAVGRFAQARGRQPVDLQELVRGGLLQKIPVDPYGGEFYISANGAVRTTSNFAFGSKAK
jgi:tetratricopeptide (TPR) repeat protein